MGMKIGFIGLGHMGRPMAQNLVRAGFALTVHDLNKAATAELLSQGAQWADSPQDLARQTDIMISSLPGPPQVEAVAFGKNGVVAGIRPGSTWIEMSTSDAELIQDIGIQLKDLGCNVLDAPVTGAVDGAQAGELTIFVGGDETILNRHRSVLEVISKKIFHAGPLGTGLAAKLVTNLLWFINAVAIGEGMVLGVKAGIEPTMLWDIIKLSAGNSWVAEHDVPAIFRGDYDPSFTLDLCNKDLTLIQGLGRQLGIPLEMGALAEQTFRRAQAQYGRDQGELHVVKLLEDATGTSLKVTGF
jgi:3-hydroxyisobutyrate dehydrogenase